MRKISILVLLVVCIFITGCGKKESKEVGTLSNFESIAKNSEFTVSDNMSEYQNVSYIIGSMLAVKDDITVEMVIYDTVDNAKKAQEGQIKSFLNIKSTGATAKKDKGENYYKYEFISNGYYMMSSRVDNTLIFSKTLFTNKQAVQNILNGMNY